MPCAPGQGTTTFQQAECVPCDELWFGAAPTSLEYHMSMTLCIDPEDDYYNNNPSVERPLSQEEQLA